MFKFRPKHSAHHFDVPSEYEGLDPTMTSQTFLELIREGTISGVSVTLKHTGVECTVGVTPQDIKPNGFGGIRLYQHVMLCQSYNLKIIRYFNQGNDNLLTCRYDGETVIESQSEIRPNGKTYSTSDINLHHMKVINGVSVTKDGSDPSVKVRKMFVDSNRKDFEDIMGTVACSSTGHRKFHQLGDLGLDDYHDHEKPWALLNEQNYNQFVEWSRVDFPIKSYQEMIDHLNI